MRAFLGLPVPEPWIGPLMRAQGRIPGGRSVPADDLHLTLAFLDDQPEARLEALHDALEARAAPAVTLTATGYASFGSKRARLVALDVAATPELSALRKRIRNACRGAGIDLPRERFRPHVTLVRFPAAAPPDPARLPRALAGLGLPEMAPAEARLAVLWGSDLTPSGPVYTPLAQYPLRAA
ncbi:RNA 2',3'-cyclic phosphodiesterase [Jannaschia ovalis]|uniref:RNA 2',3'-cyclic phosphodiesterase n=1 Tax=Jannaschia ovalis TaxID=3038773 RepID=A0ABY8L835_9RHOB|nr:RNA 2',3'-cyclic phosphodiesterase [Jannaschia sp. GRR-S6-38]WGH77527.1 RNA 2',3'-cyclic phosphodiesterase [Jannaschia sp. GRR-S6-38]